MSSRIHICPDCGDLGSKTELPERVSHLLMGVILHGRLNLEKWGVKGYWCPKCDAPYLVVWPRHLSRAERRELLMEPDSPLKIVEEEKRR